MVSYSLRILSYEEARWPLWHWKQEFPIWRQKYNETVQWVLARIESQINFYTSENLVKNINSMRVVMSGVYSVNAYDKIETVRDQVRRCTKWICVIEGDRRFIVIKQKFV